MLLVLHVDGESSVCISFSDLLVYWNYYNLITEIYQLGRVLILDKFSNFFWISLSYSFTHFIFALDLIKLLQFDKKDTSTSFIFRALVMETNVLGTAALFWECSAIQFQLSGNKELYIWILSLKLRISSSHASLIDTVHLIKTIWRNEICHKILYFH